MFRRTLLFFLIPAVTFMSCGNQANDHTSVAEPVGETVDVIPLKHPDWAKNATIYEVNIRQHTPEGTINAFSKDLERIKEMGVDILWLMPIFPIGEENRKGGLGSYYSVQNYTAVNPEFGSLKDLKNLVDKAHGMGMKVILDWVANHSAWDNPWVEAHPEWYTRDSLGQMMPPVDDWSDVADLNYDEPGMRKAMIDAMKYWVEEADVDGYRCDVAMMVPTDFWNDTRAALDSIKPVFMLAEAEQPDHLEKAFDMCYGWEFHHIINSIAKGEMGLNDIDAYMAKKDSVFPPNGYHMMFTTNHDENSWNGTVFERFGDDHKLYAVLTFTIDGMPLIYSGQEAGLDHRLAFFDKDTIDWTGYEYQDFYTRLLKLNQENPALWNGLEGGKYKRLTTEDPDLFIFSRSNGNHEVITMLNFSNERKQAIFAEGFSGELESIFNEQLLTVFTKEDIYLEPKGFQVFVR